jgi:SAM-dependent methyltransferase
MERAAYRFLEQAEHSWWYTGRRRCIKQALTHVRVPHGEILDFGAGFGASFNLLHSYGHVDAYEIDEQSVAACRSRGYHQVFTSIPPITKQYALIGAFDVIEHIEDDVSALRGLHARMKKGGIMVVTVPAYAWLWSAHDELHKHFRRYTRRGICIALTKAGFTVEYASYWNTTLMPVAYIMRKFGKGGGESLTPSPAVNRLLSAVTWVESLLITFLPLPWGTGIVAVARK